MKTTLSNVIASTLFATGLAVSFVAAPAQAASTLGACSVQDIWLGDGASATYAADCEGAFGGNDTGNGGTLLTDLNSKKLFADSFSSNQTITWSEVAKSEGKVSSGFFAEIDTNSGDWGFTKALNTNTFVVSLKSSLGYSAYLFKDYDWTKALDGGFLTNGVALNINDKSGKITAQDLSHATVFAANITTVTPPPAEVPEPATLVGLGLAFGGMLSMRRKSH